VKPLSEDELCVEADRLRKQIVVAAERLTHVCEALYSTSRKKPTELTSVYVNISNSTKRFAGSILQGAKRTEVVARILGAKKETLRLEREQEAKRVQIAKARQDKAVRQVLASERKDPYGLFESSDNYVVTEQGTRNEGMGLVAEINALYGEE
jgi:hypothetical protein